MKFSFFANLREIARNLVCASAIGGWCLAGTLACMPLIAGRAEAQVVGTDTCTLSAAPLSATATVSGVTSIVPVRLTASVMLNCSFNTDFFATCSTYAAANSVAGAPWSLIRQDGSTSVSSANNRIAIPPTIGQSPVVAASTADTLYGNRSGSANSFGIFINYAALPGAVVESGIYQGALTVTPVMIDAVGGETPDNTCSRFGSTGVTFPLDPVSIPITITVPDTCTATIPPELDFGDVSNTAIVHDAAVNVSAQCNSNTLKFNVFIDGGTGSDNAVLAMNDGASHMLTYGLFNNPERTTAFSRTGIGPSVGNAGPYTRSTEVNGAVATIYGRVPIQPRPATGDYTDTVTVHVEY